MSDSSLLPGSILGAFVVESLLGRGGMGAVYRVRNRLTNELRALKVVHPKHLADAVQRQRFMREMRLAASIQHPNVVQVYEPAMDGETLLLPMELIHGDSLATWLRVPGGRRVLTEREVLALAVPICDGVGALHAAGIVHRDLKPANIMLAPGVAGFVPKVIDLGAALEVGHSEELTNLGVVVGTPSYLATEQARGARDLDARVDVYALGVLLYELLTGRRPYEGAAEEIAVKLIQQAPYPALQELAPTVSAALATVVTRALSFDREARYGDARELREALLKSTGVAPSPSTLEYGHERDARGSAAPTPPSRRKVVAVAVGAVLLAVMSVVLLRPKETPVTNAVAATVRADEAIAQPSQVAPTTSTAPPIEPPVEQHLAPAPPTSPEDAGGPATAIVAAPHRTRTHPPREPRGRTHGDFIRLPP